MFLKTSDYSSAFQQTLVLCLCAVFGICHAADDPVTQNDVKWLNRVTYGVDSMTLAQYRSAGRKRYLETQLKPSTDALPLSAQTAVDALSISTRGADELLASAEVENKRINVLPDGDDKAKARQALQEAQDRVAFEAAKRHLLRAMYSQAQLKEQMTWFWLNHFSVFRYKANLRWSVADYEERAIRPNALGNFRDLLRATLRHPAMLVYLDNAQSSANKVNENYAREILELHTMGVNGGYTQTDVQELARILTGVGVNYGAAPTRVKPEWQGLLERDGAFEFNPARHDFGDKVFLGQTIAGKGFAEVDQALDLIVKNPATAQFISRKLAMRFVADEPPAGLVARMAQAFTKTGGDIPSVLRVMFTSKEFDASLGNKFKDPMQYVVSTLRLAYDAQTQAGKTFVNLKPANNMLNALGEGLYGHLTPEGYGLRETDWASAGQMSKRFEIAKWIGSGNAGLFDPDDGSPAKVTGFPQLSSRLYFEAIEPTLAPSIQDALSKASAQWEWNAYLLASPALMFH
jgi:uncharacterized protein (DUF1800 family)